MRRSPIPTGLVVALAATLAAAGCSSGDDPTDPGGATGTLTATLDGEAWVAQVSVASNNGFIFGLEGTAEGVEIALSVNLTENTLPGTVDLTSGSTGAQITEGGEVWYAVGTGGSGTLTVEILTSSRAKGTFQFVAGPVANSASGGTRTIVNGQFDVSF